MATRPESVPTEQSSLSGTVDEPAFRFGRVFSKRAAPVDDDNDLIELGRAMHDGPDLGEHPALPAGYTFLGQFITHDLSWDRSGPIKDGEASVDELTLARTPLFDLDCLYGAGPAGDHDNQPKIFRSDKYGFRVGSTTRSYSDDTNRKYECDLPRENGRTATIADPRNDQNLGLAQLHVAFLRFHNNVAERLRLDGLNGLKLFDETKTQVVRHYQWIVLHDFLPKILDQSVLRQELAREAFDLGNEDKPFMPVEFSHAAFRLGHSMLRDRYEWNRVFQSSIRGQSKPAELHTLFELTGLSGSMGGTSDTLPSYWIVDWTRFFDFTGYNGISNNPNFNWSGRIDTTLPAALKGMNDLFRGIPTRFLPLGVLDLVRASRLRLPTGQEVADQLGITPLTPSEVADYVHTGVLSTRGFDKRTPLWYYVLKEAQLYNGGERLGPVGSTIVARTVVQLLRVSPFSILKEPLWKPNLGQRHRDQFGMPDLLIVANVVNPLGS